MPYRPRRLRRNARIDANVLTALFGAARSSRPNPFVPKAKHLGKSARFKHWEGGFHTALDKEFTYAYAQQKWTTSQLGGYVECPDYPVILTLDMTGMPAIADIDARRAALQILDFGVVGKSLDEIHRILEIDESEYPEVGNDTLNWLFKLASPSNAEVAARLALFGIFNSPKRKQAKKAEMLIETAKKLEEQGENTRLSLSEEELLVEIFQQAVYWTPVADDRLLQVEYMHPFWDRVVPEDPHTGDEEEDEKTEKLIEEVLEAGFELLTDQDTSVNPSLVSAWKRPRRSTPLFGEEDEPRRVEYHGTALSNLLLACPWLAAKLPDPPKPQAGGIVKLVEAMQELGMFEDADKDADGEDEGSDDDTF